ncbi:MAG: hypothetical protein AAF958_01620 [Planctomycetota bacterium]
MKYRRLFSFVCLAAVGGGFLALADERRAPRPKSDPKVIDDIFFEKISDAFNGKTPSVAELRKKSTQRNIAIQASEGTVTEKGLWPKLVAGSTLEDEIKRVRLDYDATITTPGAFNSGGYQDARLKLTVLATLFAVVHEYDGQVRWKKDSAGARDLISRTARNCKAGSTQVYNEAKLRKADLQDLVSGAGVQHRPKKEENDWSMIADRSPLMEYAEELVSRLEDTGVDARRIKADPTPVRHNAQLLAMLGEVLVREGMDEADDEDYQVLSRAMSKTGAEIVRAIEAQDFEAAEKTVSQMRTRCDQCHEQYR